VHTTIILPVEDEIMMTTDPTHIATHHIDAHHLESVTSIATETVKGTDPLGKVVLVVYLEALRDETSHQDQE
jgi:hypothetical protein